MDEIEKELKEKRPLNLDDIDDFYELVLKELENEYKKICGYEGQGIPKYDKEAWEQLKELEIYKKVFGSFKKELENE